jgi:hypothetical protein
MVGKGLAKQQRLHKRPTVRGVRWQAKNTSKKRMEFPNRKLAEVCREMLNTEFKIRASSGLTMHAGRYEISAHLLRFSLELVRSR